MPHYPLSRSSSELSYSGSCSIQTVLLPGQVAVKLAYWTDFALRNARHMEIRIQIQLRSVRRRLTYLHPLAIDECFPYVCCSVYVDPPTHSIRKPEIEPGMYIHMYI